MAVASTVNEGRASGAEFPLLEQLQAVDSRGNSIEQNLRAAGGRRSTVVVAAVNALFLSVGALVSAQIAHSVSFLMAFAAAASVFVFVGTTGRFRTRMVPDFVGQLTRVAGSVAGGAAGPFLVLALFDESRTNFRAFSGLVLALFIAALAADWLAVVLIRRMWARGRLRSRAIMLGSGTLANELAVELRLRQEYGVDLVETITPVSNASLVDTLLDCFVETKADRLIVAPLEDEARDSAALVTAIRRALSHQIPTFVVPRLYEMGLGLDSMSPDRARGYPLVRLQRSAHPSVSRRMKRSIDVIVSAVVLVLSSPVMLLTALAVRGTDNGPVLFRQPRVGKGGEVFDMLKFRSMSVSDNEHCERASGHRVTAVGKVIRATSLDELPQLWNVLIGDMSLVGPRPERVSFVEEGLRLHSGYAERHRMPMGLTGLAQVAGLRGEGTSVQERVKFDNIYIDQWSVALDLQVLFKTVFAILLQGRYRQREMELSEAITQLPSDATDSGIRLVAPVGDRPPKPRPAIGSERPQIDLSAKQ